MAHRELSSDLSQPDRRESTFVFYPDGNGLELCWDRPFEEWPRDEDGRITFADRELDLEGLLAEPDLA